MHEITGLIYHFFFHLHATYDYSDPIHVAVYGCSPLNVLLCVCLELMELMSVAGCDALQIGKAGIYYRVALESMNDEKRVC